jgi:hypothetical protein
MGGTGPLHTERSAEYMTNPVVDRTSFVKRSVILRRHLPNFEVSHEQAFR